MEDKKNLKVKIDLVFLHLIGIVVLMSGVHADLACAQTSSDQEENIETSRILGCLREGSGGITPTIKDFDSYWADSLIKRGQPLRYTKDNSLNFEYIGMPIGGFATGQLYLGGNGKLWYWDIFNNKGGRDVRGVRTYADPYKRSNLKNPAYNNIQQGFAIRKSAAGQTQVRTLDRDGFSDISNSPPSSDPYLSMGRYFVSPDLTIYKVTTSAKRAWSCGWPVSRSVLSPDTMTEV